MEFGDKHHQSPTATDIKVTLSNVFQFMRDTKASLLVSAEWLVSPSPVPHQFNVLISFLPPQRTLAECCPMLFLVAINYYSAIILARKHVLHCILDASIRRPDSRFPNFLPTPQHSRRSTQFKSQSTSSHCAILITNTTEEKTPA